MADIGLTGLPLDFPHSGSAVYTRSLLRYLPDALPTSSIIVFQRRAHDSFEDVQTARLSSPVRRWSRNSQVGARADKLVWETVGVPLAAAAAGLRLLHFTYFAAPILAPCPVVVTVHDVIPMILDGYHRSRQSAWYSTLMARTVRRASRIITVSRNSQRDITRVLGVSADCIDVIYEAADERFHPHKDVDESQQIRAKYGLPERFVLYTGGAERRKNIATLVRAWSNIRHSMRESGTKLLVVASFPPPDQLYPDIPGLVRELSLGSDVQFVGAVAEEDLPALYRAAEIFCFPSTYEGFGLTPLEAMASGVPVLASDSSSIPEVVGDGGMFLPSDNIGAWSDALRQVADSSVLRQDLAKRGVERAAQFSWQRTAEQTADVYRRVLSS